MVLPPAANVSRGSFAVDRGGLIQPETDSLGNTTEYAYDELCRTVVTKTVAVTTEVNGIASGPARAVAGGSSGSETAMTGWCAPAATDH